MEINSKLVERSAHRDRRRNDGLQEGAGRSRRATSTRPRRSSARRASPPRRRRPAARPPRASSWRTSRSRARCSSRSTARRTSSRAPRTSASSPRSSRTGSRRTTPSATRAAGDVTELAKLSWPAGETVGDAVTQMVAVLKENIQIRRFARLTPRADETFASYIHGNGRIGVVVGLPGGDEALGKDLAMHIAASDPRFAARGRGVARDPRDRARDRARPGHGGRQARQRRRADRRREGREVLPGGRARRAGLREGSREDGRPGRSSSGPARAPWTCASSGSSWAKASAAPKKRPSLGFASSALRGRPEGGGGRSREPCSLRGFGRVTSSVELRRCARVRRFRPWRRS